LRQFRQPVFVHAGQPDQEITPNDLASGRGIAVIFTETDTTYNCSAQTNFGTSASRPIASTTRLCFEPPPQDQAPGVPGSTYVGPIQTYQGSTVDDSDCQAKLKALPTGETCLQPTQVCVDASPTTRTINGVAVTHDCWQWQATYQCSTLSSANDCATLSAKSNCSFDHEVCLDPAGRCLSGQERGLQMHDACHDAEQPSLFLQRRCLLHRWELHPASDIAGA
jgi:hypothetical protein